MNPSFEKEIFKGEEILSTTFKCAALEQASKGFYRNRGILQESGHFQEYIPSCSLIFNKSPLQQCVVFITYSCVGFNIAVSFSSLRVLSKFFLAPLEQEPPMDCTKRNSRSTVFRIVPKFKKEKVQKQKTSSQPGR